MDRFLTPNRIWAEPSRRHVYVLPDLTVDHELRALILL
jgi:hypothetical protein